MRFEVTTEKARIDFDRVFTFLNGESHWAAGIPRDLFDRAMANSLCFAGLWGQETVAFARVISDFATHATLVDVFVEPTFRGNGYSRALMDAVLSHPDLQDLRRFSLATRTAHGLYEKYGFGPPLFPETLMERYDPEIYKKADT